MEGKVWSDLRAHHGLASSEECLEVAVAGLGYPR